MFLFKPRWRTRKLTFFLSATLIIALIFIIYQLLMFLQLTKVVAPSTEKSRPLGVHEQEAAFYVPDSTNTFTCIKSMERIPFDQINDNYCDCLDGTDEPATNACPNGIFYCESQAYKIKSIPTSRVNDGICDCCDGSDEFDEKFRTTLTRDIQRKLGRYQSPCPHNCDN